jgi:hypothetical protein
MTPEGQSTRICSHCGATKPIEQMKKVKAGRALSWCKACHSASTSRYYRANKDAVAAKSKIRQLATLDRINGSVSPDEIRAAVAEQADSIRRRLQRKTMIAANGCWEIQTGHRSTTCKYALMPLFIKKRKITFTCHRLSAAIHHGLDIMDPKTLACHHCDNPICWRPDHLFLGTHRDNQMDSVNKGRRKLKPCA